MKTNTVLNYDDDFNNVECWGYPALAKKPNRRNRGIYNKPVELFKLHLSNLSDALKPELPYGLNYEKAITDYLREIGKVRAKFKIIHTQYYQFVNFFINYLC